MSAQSRRHLKFQALLAERAYCMRLFSTETESKIVALNFAAISLELPFAVRCLLIGL